MVVAKTIGPCHSAVFLMRFNRLMYSISPELKGKQCLMARMFLRCLGAAWRRWAGGEHHVWLEFSRLFRRTLPLRTALDKNKTSAACISVHAWGFFFFFGGGGKQKYFTTLFVFFFLEASLAVVKHGRDSCGWDFPQSGSTRRRAATWYSESVYCR